MMSVAVDTDPGGRVLWPLVPLPGESLLSWTARTAGDNVLPSPYTLLRRAGLAYTDKPVVALLRTEGAPALAGVLGGEAREVLRRMLHPCETPGFVLLDGVPVRTVGLVTNRRRFAPAALALGLAHQSIWMVRALPFCARTWQYLRDDCAECGAVQKWRHALEMSRCDRCSADLSRIEGVAVEERLRAPLASLAAW